MNGMRYLRQLKGLLRAETVLLVLILIVGVYWLAQYQKGLGAQEQQLKLERDLRVVRQNLESLNVGPTKAALLEQLQSLQSAPEPSALPPLQEGLDVSSAIVAYAPEQQLTLTTFDVTRRVASKGKAEYPAISYSIVARGTTDGLLGALGLAEAPHSATLQKLEFARDKGTGSITSLDAGVGKLVVKLDNGSGLTLRITEETVIELNGQRVPLKDLEAGAWVKVKFNPATQTASEVQARTRTPDGATGPSPFSERAWEMKLDLVVFYSQ